MIHYNKRSLGRLERLIEEQSFRIVYGKGNFGSAQCVVYEDQVIVVNKFLTIEERIHLLLEILQRQEIDSSIWRKGDQSWYQTLRNQKDSIIEI